MTENLKELAAALDAARADLDAARAELAKLGVFRMDLQGRVSAEEAAANQKLGAVGIESLVATAEKQAAAQVRIMSLGESIREVDRRIVAAEQRVAEAKQRLHDSEIAFELPTFRARVLAVLPLLDSLKTEMEAVCTAWPVHLSLPNYRNVMFGKATGVLKAIEQYVAMAERTDL